MINLLVGDKVKTTILQQGTEGTIISIHDRFYVVEFIDRHGEPYTYAYEAHELIKVDSFIKCECGAIFTWAPSIHARYCPKWRDE